jgi:hypothetical protein
MTTEANEVSLRVQERMKHMRITDIMAELNAITAYLQYRWSLGAYSQLETDRELPL